MKINSSDLYDVYFPLFVPENFYLFDLFLINKSSIKSVTCQEYFYCYFYEDFYLLDLSLIRLYKLPITKIRKVFEIGKVKGDLYLVNDEVLRSIESNFYDKYAKAFIWCEVADVGKVSGLIYFAVDKFAIGKLVNEVC